MYVVVQTVDKFPYAINAPLYTLFEASMTGAGASFSNFHVNTDSGRYDTWNTERRLLPTDPFNPSYTRALIEPNSVTETTVSTRAQLIFVLPPGGTLNLNHWLVEPNSVGDYFDGNTREGGLIPGSSGYGTGSSDYRWAGTAHQSFSYYMLDYKRMYEIADDIIKNYLVPVTIKDNITLNWNHYLGK